MLAARCGYFAHMLSPEAWPPSLTLPIPDPLDVFSLVIEFLYANHIELPTQLASGIISWALHLQIKSLQVSVGIFDN